MRLEVVGGLVRTAPTPTVQVPPFPRRERVSPGTWRDGWASEPNVRTALPFPRRRRLATPLELVEWTGQKLVHVGAVAFAESTACVAVLDLVVARGGLRGAKHPDERGEPGRGRLGGGGRDEHDDLRGSEGNLARMTGGNRAQASAGMGLSRAAASCVDRPGGPMTKESAVATARTAHAGAVALAETIAAVGGTALEAAAPGAPVPVGGPRFELRAVIGEGGMGKVHRAFDRQFGREVALKELGEGALTTEGARRFVVEALVTGNLEHPGIPAVYERGVRDGRPFYAMRKIEGRTMSEAIAAARTLPERLALVPVVVQVANTLGFAHARGVVHRDVKPDNVILDAHGAVVVLDWGIAKVSGMTDVGSAISGAAAGEAASAATVHGSVLGTPAYMAPEQARGEVDAIDARTDVFALGAMLYHVLTGQPPFSGPTSMATLAAALAGERRPIAEAAPDAPPGLCAVVEKAMSTDPRQRYENAAELAGAIGAFMIEAVTRKPSLVARVVVAVTTLAALGMMVLGGLWMIAHLPGFEMQGGGAFIYATLAAAALVLTAVEGLTRGRHGLVPLITALAAGTFLSGVGATFSGYVTVAAYVRDGIEAGTLQDVPAVVAEGAWEASGAIAVAAFLASFVLVLLAVVGRLRPAEAPRPG